MTDSVQMSHSSYWTQLQKWQQHYPSDQIFVGFYDQLVEDAEQLLTDIYTFLGIPVVITDRLAHRVNASPDSKAPLLPYLATSIATKLLPEIEMLHAHFDNQYTAQWLMDAQQSLVSANADKPQ